MTAGRRRLAVLGVALPLVLCTILAERLWQAATGESETAVASGEWSPQLPAFSQMPEPGLAATHSETLARPLFMRARRPYEPPPPAPPLPTAIPQPILPPPPVAAPPAQQLDSNVKVAGVVAVGMARWALIVSRSLPQGEWLTEGASVEGWTVAKIEREAVLLRGGGQRLRLELYPWR